jgi:hypothetical protein
MRRLKAELETLIREADQRRGIEGEKYCRYSRITPVLSPLKRDVTPSEAGCGSNTSGPQEKAS